MTAVAAKQRSAKRQPVAKSAEASVAERLLGWYDRERRELPWRFAPGAAADPYRVWLSEIMLQQTTVKAVIPYFERFLTRWPTVDTLAAAKLDDVLAAWAGLGYYSRARNLHACARAVVDRHAGAFPQSEAELLDLPGIGPYTAAAISAIAFGQRSSPVDGNIERVVARQFAVETPLPAAKPELRRLAATLTPEVRAGDFAQAMMDLGATICTPKRPSCLMCPIQRGCRGNELGTAPTLPRKLAKPERPERFGVAFVALREDGAVLLRRRPEQGLLARMMEVPSTEWTDDWPAADEALRAAPVNADWWPVPGSITHTFTHFKLELMIYRAIVSTESSLTLWADPARCQWVPKRRLGQQALPSVMRKVIGHALKDV